MTQTTKKPVLSICIPTYNRADLLRYCLENLRALDAFDIDYEVVVLNHASTDHTARMLEEMQQTWSNLRVHHQAHAVNIMGQCVAALRLARGELVTMLADDDKFIVSKFVEYVRYMQERPDVVATYTPWLAYDDTQDTVVNGYFTIPQRTEFKAGQAFALFQFMVERVMYPEIAIYRSAAFYQVAFGRDDGPFHNCIWMVELLKQGTVLFQPDVYYLEIAKVKPQFSTPKRVNLDYSLSYLDNIRAGIEVMAMRAVQASGGTVMVSDARLGIHEVLLTYLLRRLDVAYTRALGTGDFLLAAEVAKRMMLWCGPFKPNFEEQVQQILFGSGVQQAGWLLDSMSWKQEMVVYDFTEKDPVEMILRLRYPDMTIRLLDEAAIRSTVDPDKAILLVRYKQQKAMFEDIFLPGHIISLEESIEYHKLMPVQYALTPST